MPREDGRSDPQTRRCLAASDIIRDLQLAVVERRPATLMVPDDAELISSSSCYVGTGRGQAWATVSEDCSPARLLRMWNRSRTSWAIREFGNSSVICLPI